MGSVKIVLIDTPGLFDFAGGTRVFGQPKV